MFHLRSDVSIQDRTIFTQQDDDETRRIDGSVHTYKNTLISDLVIYFIGVWCLVKISALKTKAKTMTMKFKTKIDAVKMCFEAASVADSSSRVTSLVKCICCCLQ